MKLTQIVKILSLEPIPDADRIERARVLGWDCVVQKGLHRVGDTVVFVFPDTNVPKKFLDKTYEGDETVRLRTVKMRGQFSAGLILPFSVLPKNIDFIEGDDVSSWLGITKWEAPIPAQLAGMADGVFPTFLVSKTDEDNYRSNPEALQELVSSPAFEGQHLVATQKIDGSSGTFILDHEDKFIVCSRNLMIKKDEKNVFWRIAEQFKIEEILRKSGRHLAIQGEVYGEGIQKNPVGIKGISFAVFLIKDLDTGNWLSWDETVEFCKSVGLEHVPEVYRILSVHQFSAEMLQDLADKSVYVPSNKPCEGLVLRTVNPVPSAVLGKSWWSVKFISQPYDTKKG